jgi:hypothetical protein
VATSVGSPPDRSRLWDEFMVPDFVACLFLGMTVGLFFGAVVWKTAEAFAVPAIIGLAVLDIVLTII